jgi:RNA polymerase sigma-70 factor (ECF subfamily)
MQVAEAELFERFAWRIRAFGLRHLADAAAADDLVQQVLMVVVDSLRGGKVREPEQLASFVLGTARRIALAIRSGDARHDRLIARWAPAPEPTEPAPCLDLDRLRGCLEALPPKEHAVVVLSFYADQDGEAIAGELGTSTGNVRVIRHRAIERLKSCMELPR